MQIRGRGLVVLVGSALVSSLVWAGPAAGDPSPSTALPNLVINGPRLGSSVVFKTQNFTAKDCAYVEGSLTGTGKRTLVRFDVSAANQGAAPMALGDPRGNQLFEYSACHRHNHFSGYALYELFGSDPGTGRTTTAPLLTGRKQAFCLEDFERDPGSPTAGPAFYTCANQGISVGWADTYGSYLDGQWIDVTGRPPGQYWLRVTINPYNVDNSTSYAPDSPVAKAIPESSYADNVAVVAITIPTKIAGGPPR